MKVFMSHISTDQKLQLVHTIRMQNQYNRMKCRERERMLYGISQTANDRRELYSAETAMSLPVTGEKPISGKKSRVLTGFRLRFLIALILLSGFIYLDKNEISLFDNNTFDIFTFVTKSIDLPDDIPFLNSVDL